MSSYYLKLLLVCVFVVIPQVCSAILPPDIVVNTGSQMVQFFSVAALMVSVMFSFVVFLLRQFLWLSRQYAWFAVAMIMTISLVATSLVFLSESKIDEQKYQAELARLQSLNESLQDRLRASYSPEEIARLVEHCSNRTQIPSHEAPLTTDACEVGAYFFSTAVSLYGEFAGHPFVLQIDLNRLEELRGVYSQYFFLNGTMRGQPFADYVSSLATSAEPLPAGFLSKYNLMQYPDLSTRHSYEIGITYNNKPLTVKIVGLNGDFVTRDSIFYTRLQSVGDAEVTYDGVTFFVKALVESTASTDYTKQIFFPGHKELMAETHQFILWDERGNYYMIDDTKVDTPTSVYPSHTWLLYKNSSSGVTKKSFTANLRQTVGPADAVQWVLSMPEFGTATATLSLTEMFKQESDDRIRGIVAGVIEDESGRRQVQGIVHWVKNENR